ncbi:LLM class flavin-dependent oxidoreductase [Mesorhizobium sp. J8]|nr:LLM class flavin-dependent oxidoreductase [Mesorhizobium sp. J8]
MTALSVLDLSPVTQGSTASQSLANSLDLARHAERLGYKRYWLAEHHNTPGSASAATSVVIAHAAGSRPRGQQVGARRAAESKVDAAGKERRQRAELLADHQRRMVGQHDAACADADRLGVATLPTRGLLRNWLIVIL